MLKNILKKITVIVCMAAFFGQSAYAGVLQSNGMAMVGISDSDSAENNNEDNTSDNDTNNENIEKDENNSVKLEAGTYYIIGADQLRILDSDGNILIFKGKLQERNPLKAELPKGGTLEYKGTLYLTRVKEEESEEDSKKEDTEEVSETAAPDGEQEDVSETAAPEEEQENVSETEKPSEEENSDSPQPEESLSPEEEEKELDEEREYINQVLLAPFRYSPLTFGSFFRIYRNGLSIINNGELKVYNNKNELLEEAYIPYAAEITGYILSENAGRDAKYAEMGESISLKENQTYTVGADLKEALYVGRGNGIVRVYNPDGYVKTVIKLKDKKIPGNDGVDEYTFKLNINETVIPEGNIEFIEIINETKDMGNQNK